MQDLRAGLQRVQGCLGGRLRGGSRGGGPSFGEKTRKNRKSWERGGVQGVQGGVQGVSGGFGGVQRFWAKKG